MGLGQYNSLGEYCDPHTASSVLLIFIHLAYIIGAHMQANTHIMCVIDTHVCGFACMYTRAHMCVPTRVS